jgi:anti-anti-sigma factor
MAILRRWEQHMGRPSRPLSISLDGPDERTRIALHGPATAAHVAMMRERFRRACDLGRDIELDLNGLDTIDSAGLGQILRLLADVTSLGLKLRITGIVPRIERRLRLEAVAWLC